MTRAVRAPTHLDWCLVIEDRCAPTIVDRIIREAEPYLKRAARHIAADYPGVAKDLMQEARITLWELDLGRFAQRDAVYLRRMLCTRMIQVYRHERRGGLTTGWSKRAERDASSVERGVVSASRKTHHAPRTTLHASGSCASKEITAR